MDGVEKFIEDLLAERGMGNLDPELKTDLKTQLTQELMDQIDRAAINALPEEKAVELAKKLDEPDFTSEQATKFIQDAGVDLQQVSLDTMLLFRKFYLDDVYKNVDRQEAVNE